MLKEIPKSDIIVRPFKVYKEWSLHWPTEVNESIYDDDIISPVFGIDGVLSGSNNGDYTSELDQQKILYRSIEAQFYRNSATASILTEVGRRKSYASTNERNLSGSFILLSPSQSLYGEGMKPGSVKFTSGNTILQDDGYSNLVSSSAGIETIYGNVFYDRGFVVLTKDVNGPIVSGSSFVSYSLDFRSTKTIFENEIFISVLESEFNVSTNPTSFLPDLTEYDVVTQNVQTKKYDGSIENTELKYYNLKFARVNPLFWEYDFSASNDPTGSYLAPYITTIGLYDNEMNMIAVAKLPQPIKSLPDYPLNFIIRFDT
jgi:hypothetical protein